VNNLSKSKLDGKISMFVGMDLHKNYLQIAVMNDKGKVLENSRINNDLKQVGRFFNENIKDEKVRVVMESSSVWYNIYSYLSEEKHLNVVLSNPIKTRGIASAKIKTDKLDAATLTFILYYKSTLNIIRCNHYDKVRLLKETFLSFGRLRYRPRSRSFLRSSKKGKSFFIVVYSFPNNVRKSLIFTT